MFIWQQQDWPNFTLQHENLLQAVSAVRLKQGKLLGEMAALGFDINQLTQLGALTEDALKTSEIEGEVLNRDEVRSSVARRLGLESAAVLPSDVKVDGLVEMLWDATENYQSPLTKDRLCGWHAALFPTGHSGIHPISTGRWRDDKDGPMRVISGPLGRQRVHYEAPPAERIESEIDQFLQWFNRDHSLDGVLRAAIAHLWFVTIHPFEDGNGRIARAIADMALARSEGSDQRFYSMSAQIRIERQQYYKILERTQRGGLDVTAWADWFLICLGRALDSAKDLTGKSLEKAAFWQSKGDQAFNARQKKVINLLLDGLEGKLTAPKWAKMTKCSPATAQRDIQDLLARNILTKGPGGSKNTNYELAR